MGRRAREDGCAGHDDRRGARRGGRDAALAGVLAGVRAGTVRDDEAFVVGDVRRWLRVTFGVTLPVERTAVFGASAGGELALALGARHPDVFGMILCGSPGAGYRPPAKIPADFPRTYLVAGTGEPFFLDNAVRWHTALRDAGIEVVLAQREGSHGSDLWRTEFPRMITWAFD